METLYFKQSEEGPLRLVVERGSHPNAPLLFMIHGGGWNTGVPECEYDLYKLVCARLHEAGWALASVQYRLAGSDKNIRWNDQMDDILDALTWIAEHAGELNADPQRVFTMGMSAGGHLSLLTALGGSLLRPSLPVRILGEVDLCGPADLSTSEGYVVGDWMDAFNELAGQEIGAPLLSSTVPLYRRGSPYYYLTPMSPPIFLIHGTADTLVPFRNAQAVYDRARALGVPVVLCPVNGGWHDYQPSVQHMHTEAVPLPGVRATPDLNAALRMATEWLLSLEAAPAD